MINVNKVVFSHRITCNNGKKLQYIEDCQVDGDLIILLFINTPKNIFIYGYLNTIRTKVT